MIDFILKNIEKYKTFILFLFSSGSSFVLDLILFEIFCRLLKDIDFTVVSYIIVATIAARILSALYNFTINYKKVFKAKNTVGSSMIKYTCLAIAIVLVSGITVDRLHSMLAVPELAIKMPVDILLFVVSFVVQKLFVFNKQAD